MSVKCLEYRA